VARDERDAPPGNGADRDRRRRRPVGRVHRDLLDVVQERVEARAPEHADADRFAHADFSVDFDDEDDSELDDDDESLFDDESELDDDDPEEESLLDDELDDESGPDDESFFVSPPESFFLSPPESPLDEDELFRRESVA
jgi:hypothetical protein